MTQSSKRPCYNTLPTKLTEKQFNEFILPSLSIGSRGPKPKLSFYKIFTYILFILYTGAQWHMLPVEKDQNGLNEIHHTQIFRKFNQWSNDGSLINAFESSVLNLEQHDMIDPSVLHGDGTSTAAKKGGDNLGYSGHKHFKGEKVIAIVDRNANVIAPFTTAAGNCHECPLFEDAFSHLKRMFSKLKSTLIGSIMSLDSAYDSKKNRKMIFNSGMVPNIKENPRNRRKKKRGRKRIFNQAIYEERFRTVERTFAWEDKYKRLLLRFEFKSINHLGMKLLAYTLINLRHFV